MQKLISWVEIPAVKFKRAVKFYNTLLDLDLEVIDCGKEKMACFPGGEGAVSYAPDFNPSVDGTLVSLNVPDINLSLERIKAGGGSVVRKKTKIEAEGRGYFALFIDCEGNKIGLYSDN